MFLMILLPSAYTFSEFKYNYSHTLTIFVVFYRKEKREITSKWILGLQNSWNLNEDVHLPPHLRQNPTYSWEKA